MVKHFGCWAARAWTDRDHPELTVKPVLAYYPSFPATIFSCVTWEGWSDSCISSSSFDFVSIFWDSISWSPSCPWTSWVAEEIFGLRILLSPLLDTSTIDMCHHTPPSWSKDGSIMLQLFESTHFFHVKIKTHDSGVRTLSFSLKEHENAAVCFYCLDMWSAKVNVPQQIIW